VILIVFLLIVEVPVEVAGGFLRRRGDEEFELLYSSLN
jgi:hypothetical protein